MNPKSFLTIGGIILVIVGIVGFLGIIGPTSEQSIFRGAWWFDNAENWAHLVLGIVALIVAFALPKIQKGVVILVGILGILVGLYSLIGNTNLLGANLENPLDSLLHLIIGIWALVSIKGSKASASA